MVPLVLCIAQAAQTLRDSRTHQLWENLHFSGEHLYAGEDNLQVLSGALWINTGRHSVTRGKCDFKKANNTLGKKIL